MVYMLNCFFFLSTFQKNFKVVMEVLTFFLTSWYLSYQLLTESMNMQSMGQIKDNSK
ncbi:hypothetical protein RchiOBHm_Chr7g0212301 [Rosa chinensis]|uniref:Uncharacterized protein n=1 Tax=Rosa chinensis TaxID=74649 RepID=A0A2P6PAQ4_ROSCH|nr:hypothetical protein RchiOBHm_Chr7g0212301 [Rosa chinensis]